MILKFSINHFTFQCFELVNYSTLLWYSVMWIWAFFTLKIKIFVEKVFAFFLLEFTASLFSMALPLVLSPTLRVVEMFSLLYEVCQVFFIQRPISSFIKIDKTNNWYLVHQASILNEGSPIFWILEDFFWSIKQSFYEVQSSKTKISLDCTGNIIPFVASTIAKRWMTVYEPFIRWRRTFLTFRGVSYHFFLS